MSEGIIQAGSAFVPTPISRDRGQNESAAMVLAATRQAEIQARYLLAQQNPRDLDVVREKLLKECRRPSFADVARYRKPIGKGVEGLSIRFAEAALRIMKNITINQTVVSEDDLSRKILVEVADVEELSSPTRRRSRSRRRSNGTPSATAIRSSGSGRDRAVNRSTSSRRQKTISSTKRTRSSRKRSGRKDFGSFLAISWTSASARSWRPSGRRKDAEDPDGAKRRIFDSFATIGVQVDQLKLYLGHDGSAVNPKELQELRAIYSAIRDSETTWKATIDPVLAERKKAEGTAEKSSTPGSRKGMSAVADAVNRSKKSDDPAPANSTHESVAPAAGSERSK